MPHVNDQPPITPAPLKKMRGSLGRRILLICGTCIGAPFILYFIYIFQSNTQRHINHIYRDLRHTEAVQVELLHRWTISQYNTLDLIHLLFHKKHEGINAKVKEQFDEAISGLIEHVKIFGLYIEYLGGREETVVLSSEKGFDPALIKRFVPKVGPRHNMTLIDYPGLGPVFVISSLHESPQEIISMVVPAERVVQILFLTQSHYPETISILDQAGKVIASSNTELIGKLLGTSKGVDLQITPMKGIPDGWTYMNGNLKEYVAFADLPLIHGKLMVGISQSYMFAKWNEYLRQLLILLGTIVVVGGVLAYLVAWRLSKPMRALVSVMKNVGDGDLNLRYSTDRMGFEINHLGQIFNRTVENMMLHMQQAQEERIHREVFEAELAIGEKTQLSILPKKVPDVPNLDVGFGFLAAKEVGGDFYDIFRVGEDHLWLCIADTSGKGVSACLYSLLVRSMFRSFAIQTQDLEKVIQQTNTLFMKDCDESGFFVTAWVAIYNIKTHALTYASCGHHPSLLIKSSSKIIELGSEGMALGVSQFDPQVHTTTLEPSDNLLLFTDGVIEAHNPQNQLYGKDRLIRCMQNNHDKNASGLVDSILADVRIFSESTLQFDDMTLLVLKPTQQ